MTALFRRSLHCSQMRSPAFGPRIPYRPGDIALRNVCYGNRGAARRKADSSVNINLSSFAELNCRVARERNDVQAANWNASRKIHLSRLALNIRDIPRARSFFINNRFILIINFRDDMQRTLYYSYIISESYALITSLRDPLSPPSPAIFIVHSRRRHLGRAM